MSLLKPILCYIFHTGIKEDWKIQTFIGLKVGQLSWEGCTTEILKLGSKDPQGPVRSVGPQKKKS